MPADVRSDGWFGVRKFVMQATAACGLLDGKPFIVASFGVAPWAIGGERSQGRSAPKRTRRPLPAPPGR
jgi:hypothetical protein